MRYVYYIYLSGWIVPLSAPYSASALIRESITIFCFFHPDLWVIFKQQKLTITNSMKTFTYCNIILTRAASIHNLTKNTNDTNDVLLFRMKHVNYGFFHGLLVYFVYCVVWLFMWPTAELMLESVTSKERNILLFLNWPWTRQFNLLVF